MEKLDLINIQKEVVDRLSALNPDKIVLFGSYAYGVPTSESDIDLYLFKEGLNSTEFKNLRREARKKLIDLTFKYDIGFDILASTEEYVKSKEDYFYKVDIGQNSKVWYE